MQIQGLCYPNHDEDFIAMSDKLTKMRIGDGILPSTNQTFRSSVTMSKMCIPSAKLMYWCAVNLQFSQISVVNSCIEVFCPDQDIISKQSGHDVTIWWIIRIGYTISVTMFSFINPVREYSEHVVKFKLAGSLAVFVLVPMAVWV